MNSKLLVLASIPFALVMLAEPSKAIVGQEQGLFTTLNAIGKDETPTPVGHYEVDKVILGAKFRKGTGEVLIPGSKGYPLGLAVIMIRGQAFALHGTNHPELLGTKVSHGCIRMSQQGIKILASYAVPGTAIYIQQRAGDSHLLRADFEWKEEASH